MRLEGGLIVHSIGTDKKFTGHQQEGDLYFMQARSYDPEIGRFLQPDTIVPDRCTTLRIVTMAQIR